MSAARGEAWPIRAMSSFVVIPGMRAVSVAAWWRRSWGRSSAGAPVAATAARQTRENVARRSGPPAGPVQGQTFH